MLVIPLYRLGVAKEIWAPFISYATNFDFGPWHSATQPFVTCDTINKFSEFRDASAHKE